MSIADCGLDEQA